LYCYQTITKEMKTEQEIKSHLRNGDYSKIAEILGVKRTYAIMILRRPTAERYNEALEVAKKVAEANQKLGLK
jgi:hypothetical protein